MARPSHSFPQEPVLTPGGERVVPRKGVRAILEDLMAHPGFGRGVAHVHKLGRIEARHGDWPEGLAPGLREAFEARGMRRPYVHQSVAMEAALASRHFVVVTPTASGKSLCYNVPVLDAVLRDPQARALYLFPTKALSHDQYGELYALAEAAGGGIRIYTYDGDTPPATRRALRDNGHVVVTNPDMLHAGILPHHTNWVRLFENLKYIVIDELHQYRGIFGSHLANVLQRLRRLCAFHGSNPTFLCSSATIANPKELAENLTGACFEVIEESGAPRGEKTFIFYNPPVVNRELGVRRSPRLEAQKLALRFLAHDHQVIVFGRSRMDVEVMTTYLKRGMGRLNRDPQLVTGYRGGYLPTERRAIEQGLKNRDMLGVVSTNALELGVDIGSLDVSILAGWPGTIASAWQQAGRAGRKTADSVCIYIAGSSPLDQFLMNHPEFFFGRSPEHGFVQPDNLAILSEHLKCAAFELPIEDGEAFAGVDPGPVLQLLEDERLLRHSGRRWFYSSDAYPAEDVSLRRAAGENFIVLDTGRNNAVIAEVDYDSAPFLVHDDAVYIHNGRTFLVEKLDWDRRTAFVRHKIVDYYTDAQSSSTIQVLAVDAEEPGCEGGVLGPRRFGEVAVTTVVTKFKKVKFETQESIGYGPVATPPLEIQTEAAWYTFNKPEVLPRLHTAEFGAVLNAVGNLLRHAIPLYLMCDARDFGVTAMARSPFDQLPAVYVWDRYPGGIGIARRLGDFDREVFAACLRMVSECPCESGCPACIGAQLEGESPLKGVAREFLGLLTGG